MKKILLIFLLLGSVAYGDVLPTETDYIENVGQRTTITEYLEDDYGYLLFVMKTSTYLMDTLNMEVKTVEAHIVVNAKASGYSQLKAIVEKDGTQYIYNLSENVEYLPLQMGSGAYDVSLLGSNDGRRYRKITTKTFNVTVEENAVFLSRSQTVNWDDEAEVAILAKALTLKLESSEEKLEAIHTYIVENVRYDYVKANNLPKGYIPNADETLEEGKGICYDFAAVLASMMRSVDVPSKLIKGYSAYTPVYHAWNEVLIEDEWWVIDASTDSIFLDHSVTYSISKSVNDYLTSKEY